MIDSARRAPPLVLLVAVAGLLLSACTETTQVRIGEAGQGEKCRQTSDCQAGLMCSETDTCTPVDPIATGPQRGDDCATDLDCAPDLVCGRQGVCTTTHGAAAGEACGLSIDCLAGLVCHGEDATCVDPATVPDGKGVRDLGESCAGLTDCRRPFVCAVADLADARCEKIPFFPGPDCSRTDEERGAFRVYFELTEAEQIEFYRLPFPSDIRAPGGHIDLSGHPAPGEALGIDVAGEYLTAVEQDADGFALNGPVFFRLTDFPQPSSICLDAGGIFPAEPAGPWCEGGGPASVYLVDITPGSPTYDQRLPVEIALFAERSQYMCPNAIGLAPLPGRPLLPGTTYAAVLTTDLRDIRDAGPIQDLDFVRVLDGDPGLSAEVLQATDPLRAWISDRGVDRASLAAATVFTTGDPARVGRELYDAVQALPDPVFDAGAFSCDDPPAMPTACQGRLLAGGTVDGRACGDAPAAMIEVQGTYQGPVFQQGTRPYLTSDFLGDVDSGVFNRDGQGHIAKVRDETMCYSLVVPRGVPTPQGGWPIVIYAHGTNGYYRSFTGKTVVADLVAQGFAVIGFDNVMHGPRQDPSANPDLWLADAWNIDQPGEVFFNVINPRAARDNSLQGAADLHFLARLVSSDAPQVAGLDLSLDPDKVYFIGHSQGTTIASAFLPHDEILQAAVLSGAGAELVLSILNKTEPVDIAELVGTLFADQGLSRIHPMMGLLTILFGPADGLVYGRQTVLNPPRRPLPLLMYSGIGDSYTPYPTQAALMRAMGIPLVLPVVESVDGVDEVGAPVTNTTIHGQASGVAAGALQFTPPGGADGHFVMFDIQAARDALVTFMTSALAGDARIER